MLKWLLIGIWLAPVALAVGVLPAAPLGIRPDPFVWPVAFLGLFARDRQAVAYVVGLGLLRDVFTAGPFGVSPLLYAIVFRAVHENRHRVYRQSLAVQAGVGLLASLLASGLEAAVLRLSGARLPLADALQLAGLLALPTALLAPIAFLAYRRWLHRCGARPNAVGDYAI